LAIVLSPLAIVYWLGYRIAINVSDSFPNKFYLAEKINGNADAMVQPFAKGTLILFSHSLPEPYEKRLNNIDLLKSVACVEGDYLERIDSVIDKPSETNAFLCNGEPIAVVQPFDSKGRPYEISFSFNGVIPKDKLFVTAPHLYSFDSRHFGFIDRSQITGVVKCVIY
jgi:type IV secretory pathway protease TraF